MCWYELLYDASKREVSTQPQLNVLPLVSLPDVDVLVCDCCDASKREVSTQPQLTVLPHAYLMLMCWYVIVVMLVSVRCPRSLS